MATPKKTKYSVTVKLAFPLLLLSQSCLALTQDPSFMNHASLRDYQYIHESNNTAHRSNALTSLAAKIPPYHENVFVFSPALHKWAAYDQYGHEVAGGIANGGADQCQETEGSCRTPVGEFRVTRKKGVECESSQFPVGEGGSPMPYCTFFKNGNAIHGSPYISQQNGSHGCIRVLTPAARWLSLYFLKRGTKVVVLPYS